MSIAARYRASVLGLFLAASYGGIMTTLARSARRSQLRLALAVVALAAFIADPVVAAAVQPVRYEFGLDEVVFAPRTSAACGFAVYHHDVGTVRVVLFEDAVGVIVRETDQSLLISTWFSPDTGNAFKIPGPAKLHTFYDGNEVGDPALAILTGLQTGAPGVVTAGEVIIPSVVTGIGPLGIPDIDQVAPLTVHGSFPEAAALLQARCAALA
jgi:hypothetical protein